jgi:hypothetical protein
MFLTDVVTATNMNPTYYKFIPIFIKCWKKLFPSINIHIVVVADELIDELQPYKEHLKLFKPIDNVETSFIAQNIRLFYPALLKEAKGGIIITDMDMVPMNTSYYVEPIKDISNDKFVCYRPLSCVGKNEMVICYNIAHQNTWSQIFNINTENDIIDRILSIYQKDKYFGKNANIHYKPYWITDQLYLYEKTQEWNVKTNNLVILDDKNMMNRIDKTNTNPFNMEEHFVDISNGFYSDFHMFRPYDNYITQINRIIENI